MRARILQVEAGLKAGFTIIYSSNINPMDHRLWFIVYELKNEFLNFDTSSGIPIKNKPENRKIPVTWVMSHDPHMFENSQCYHIIYGTCVNLTHNCEQPVCSSLILNGCSEFQSAPITMYDGVMTVKRNKLVMILSPIPN